MFNDEKLNEVLKTHQLQLIENLKMLDAISDDIKTMQKVLKDYGVPNQRMDIEHTDEALIWDGEVINLIQEEEIKPLIQTKKEIRLQVKPLLPVFLKECLKNLGA